ncbi:RfbC dTDP-4-dehydrorhamnose 3,5-epimerase and related enzymes [Candidatus Methylopumilus universalis]|uniref:dTDP-4-dehydrorhamnose 3,5-epimerase n=1 Tax=Candidatus Methylopumilus universalis TaxID=2588536 RepID=UPI003BEEFEB9
MKVTSLEIPDVLIIEPQAFEDDRGFFFESFNQAKFDHAIGRDISFVQDNHSKSVRGVLRGLHYQESKPQAKLLRVTQGEVFDVAVDIRPNSPSLGRWVGVVLTAENKKQLWIPEGFAHGFLVLSDVAEFQYKVTNYYNPELEKCIFWKDSDLDIRWPLQGEPLLSKRDGLGILFQSVLTSSKIQKSQLKGTTSGG